MTLPQATEIRQVKYLHNIVKQNHRFMKQRAKLGLGFGSFNTARRRLKSHEAITRMRKDRIRDVDHDDILG